MIFPNEESNDVSFFFILRTKPEHLSFHSIIKYKYPLLFSPHPLLFQAVGISVLTVQRTLKYSSSRFREIKRNLIQMFSSS